MAKLRIALEWFLNPDHLPLLAARAELAREGLEVELIAPDDHYDGFVELAAGHVDLVTNEPLHLLEQHAAPLASLGTFFHTDGGILITAAARQRLIEGGAITVSSPVSNPVTDGLCRDILAGWLQRQGHGPLQEGQVTVREAGFNHVDNLATGADAAWLAFANIELIDAHQRGLDISMISTTDGGIPGFSALELIGLQQPTPEQAQAYRQMVAAMNRAIPHLQAHPEVARTLWYEASGETPNPTTDATIADTLTRFVAPVQPDAKRWLAVWEHMSARGADIVDRATYDRIFTSLA